MVNYNQAYLESLVKPGSTRLSILVDNCQKPGKSGSTRVYQAHQAFNQTLVQWTVNCFIRHLVNKARAGALCLLGTQQESHSIYVVVFLFALNFLINSYFFYTVIFRRTRLRDVYSS